VLLYSLRPFSTLLLLGRGKRGFCSVVSPQVLPVTMHDTRLNLFQLPRLSLNDVMYFRYMMQGIWYLWINLNMH
jgi:hypothetical protein